MPKLPTFLDILSYASTLYKCWAWQVNTWVTVHHLKFVATSFASLRMCSNPWQTASSSLIATTITVCESPLKDNHHGAYLPCQNILLELLEKTKLRKVLFDVFYCYVSSLPKPNHSKASFLKFYLPNYLFFFCYTKNDLVKNRETHTHNSVLFYFI